MTMDAEKPDLTSSTPDELLPLTSGDVLGELGTDDEYLMATEDLRRSLGELSRLGMSGVPLRDSLTSVAQLAVRAIPGADGAGLTLMEAGHPDTIVASTDFVTEVDGIQYGLGEGPCITAARTGETVQSGSLGGDKRWTKFGARVARLGVHSVLSLPLATENGILGAMNVYAHGKHAFTDESARVGELFAVPAAVAAQNAQVLAQARRLAEQLQEALVSRAMVDRAVGIFMSRTGATETDALNKLRALSQTQHEKLTAVAERVVSEAVRRARARHVSGPSTDE